jgi:peptide/nickel transport system permease protein
MIALLVRRVATAILTLLLVSILIFVGTDLLPGDAAQATLGLEADASAIQAARESLGLGASAPVRYWQWLTAIAGGDAGLSYANRRSVARDLWLRLDNTVFLAGVSALFFIPIAIALGILAAMWHGSRFDRYTRIAGLMAISLPEFLIGYLLILILASRLELFPSLSAITTDMPLADKLHAIVLPALTLSLGIVVYIMRMTRSAILAVLAQPYIEMARLKGVPRARIVLVHALPNAWAPIIQVVAFNLAYMIVGVVVVEVVYVYPGIGQYLVDAVAKRDVNVVQACGLIFGGAYIGINLVADMIGIFSNPRLRYPR